MARRKAKKTRRRKTGVSLLNVAETYALANVATQTVFNATPITFLTGNTASGVASGVNAVSLKEIFARPEFIGKVVQKNIRSNWMMGVAGMVLIPIGFRIGKAVARPAISKANRMLGKVGISKTVKV